MKYGIRNWNKWINQSLNRSVSYSVRFLISSPHLSVSLMRQNWWRVTHVIPLPGLIRDKRWPCSRDEGSVFPGTVRSIQPFYIGNDSLFHIASPNHVVAMWTETMCEMNVISCVPGKICVHNLPLSVTSHIFLYFFWLKMETFFIYDHIDEIRFWRPIPQKLFLLYESTVPSRSTKG